MFTRAELENRKIYKADLETIFRYLYGFRPFEKTKKELVEAILEFEEKEASKSNGEIPRSARIRRIYNE